MSETSVNCSEQHFCPPYPFPFQQSVEVVPNGTTCVEVARRVAERNKHMEDWDESFFVCDLGRLLDQYEKYKKALPRVEVCFATKANSLQPIISTMTALGCGFDCASKNEIALVLRSGVDPEKIVFAHTCKFSSHILYAKKNGVKTLVFDNKEEFNEDSQNSTKILFVNSTKIHKIKEFHPKARLLLRISTGINGARSAFGNKFGASVEESRLLIKTAWKLELNITGTRWFALSESLDECFPPESNVRIVSEPGRFFPAPALALVTNVFGKKIVEDEVCYYVGDGIYNSFSSTLMEKAKFIPEPLQDLKGNLRNSKFYGVSCDGSDVIIDSVMMSEVDRLSWIYWKEMGSYTALTQFGFNGFVTYKAFHFITESKL